MLPFSIELVLLSFPALSNVLEVKVFYQHFNTVKTAKLCEIWSEFAIKISGTRYGIVFSRTCCSLCLQFWLWKIIGEKKNECHAIFMHNKSTHIIHCQSNKVHQGFLFFCNQDIGLCILYKSAYFGAPMMIYGNCSL